MWRDNVSVIVFSDGEMSMNDDVLKVEWENLNEGWHGDYNPEDPDDENLLRFSAYAWSGDRWEYIEDSSYCTRVPASTDEAELERLLRIIFNEFRDVITDYETAQIVSVKKLGERLSWIA